MKPVRFNDTNGPGPCPRSALHLRVPILLLFAIILLNSWVSLAHAETRTLRMYFTHTKESATITFKKNGKYVNSGLRKANRFLRDWRRKEPTKMDPQLLDLVWEVYQKSGSRKPIHVISGYRSPRTNNMLRRRGRKVAKTSQHTKGRALDFFMPDVSVAKLRALGLKAHRGGVGYYSGSFVHLDTGRVRHWPRMSSRQLKKVFPRGRTIHIPSNGKALKGYKVAKANLKRGLNADGSRRTTSVKATALASLFDNKNAKPDEEERAARRRVAAKRPKLEKPVAAASLRRRPKPSGPDPFSIERTAAGTTAQQDKKKERELAAAKLAQAVERGLTEDGRPQSELVLASLAVPSRRPETPGTANTDRISEASTQLALATSRALNSNVRPPADIPQSNTSTAEPEVAGLKARIETALARGRDLTPAEKAAEQQSNSKLAEALKEIPIPRIVQDRPATIQLALATVPEPTPRRDPITTASNTIISPETPAPSRLAAISEPEPTTPSWRFQPEQNALSADSLRVPLPSSNPNAERPLPATAEPSTARSYALSLGELDGRSVKRWAVSLSTRVGPAAELKAPNYRQGTKSAAPDQVYSAGFDRSRFRLRTDRFSGRALTRVAFANFKPGS